MSTELLPSYKIKVQFNIVDVETNHSKYEIIEMIIPHEIQRNLLNIAIEDQLQYIDDYIATLDKRYLMNLHDWKTIIDWSFVMNEEQVKAFFMFHGSDNHNFLANIDICYSYMKKSIEHLSPKEQIQILLASINFGIAGVRTTTKSFSDILNRKEKDEPDDNIFYLAKH